MSPFPMRLRIEFIIKIIIIKLGAYGSISTTTTNGHKINKVQLQGYSRFGLILSTEEGLTTPTITTTIYTTTSTTTTTYPTATTTGCDSGS